MSTKEIIETGQFWIVNVDPELIPTSRFDYINKERGVKRVWGIDPETKEYFTSHVYYPKSEFSKEHLERNVVPKFDTCPHCRQGKCGIKEHEETINSPEKNISPDIDFKFKYKPSHTMNYKNKSFLKTTNMKKLKINLTNKTIPYAGQGLAALIRMPVSYMLTDLWSSILFGATGAVGNIINEKYNLRENKKKQVLREMFTNMMFTFSDLSANKAMSMKSSATDLWNGIRYGNYKTAFGSVFENSSKVFGSLKSIMPNFSFKNPFKGKFGSAGFKMKSPIIPGITQQVSKADVQVYASKDDISDY